jgi:V/A-type H+-transporting ATPase subunit D
MARAALNKSALHKQRDELRLYERLLPSLDLKRMQLTGELGRARDTLAREQAEVEREGDRIAGQLPMLANREIDLSGIVRVGSVQMEEENVVGVKLPVLMGVTFSVHEYSMLAKPHWVDVASAAAGTRSTAYHSACQPFRKGPDPGRQGKHQIHPDFSGRC